MTEHSRTVLDRDAVVVGANTAGLTVAHVLSQFGFRTTVVEKAPAVGGMDRSFTIAGGRRFDCGLHVLDYMRSELVTRLFREMVDGDVHLVERRRTIAIRNRIFPYNSTPDAWPEELRALLPDGEIVDRLGDDAPTRENLARYYGRPFTDMIFDEVLASYPSETRHLGFGVPEHALMANVYPWFFPNVRRETLADNASRRYHDSARRAPKEYFLYPRRGGFGTFADGFRAKLEAAGTEFVVGADDLELALERGPEGVRVDHVVAGGRRYSAPRVFWCAPGAVLQRVLGQDVPDLKPDRYLIGSFEFERPLEIDFHELVVGDPAHRINRLSWNGWFLDEDRDLLQLEFCFPRADAARWERSPEAWRDDWVASLRGLGLLADDNGVRDFDLKTFPILYNCYGVEGRPMPEITFDLGEDTNLVPVLPTVRNININTRVPQFVRFMADELTRVRPRAPIAEPSLARG